MIKSLTGFGSIELNDKSNQLTINIRSVNSRFLDVKFRGIDLAPEFENDILLDIQNTLIRGSITVQIFFKNGSRSKDSVKFDRERFESIESIVNQIQLDYGKHIDVERLINLNDIIVSKDFSDLDQKLIIKNVKKVLQQVDKMRSVEGSTIKKDILTRVGVIEKSFKQIESKSKDYVNELNQNYNDRIKALLSDVSIDENRIAQEVAIMVDKYDFTEEVVRGQSHCSQFRSFLNSSEPVGKKLNFLLQELTREVNTIGSKSPSSEISTVVVEIKNEVERIREQVQNIL